MCKDNRLFRDFPTSLSGKSPKDKKSLPYLYNVNKFK